MSNILHIPSITTVSLHGAKPMTKRLSTLRESWMDKIADLVNGIPPKVSPFRMTNHEINLIDPKKWINYHLPKCPDTCKEELAEKISWYTVQAGGFPLHYGKPYPCYAFSRRMASCTQSLTFACRTTTQKRTSHPFWTKTLYGMTSHVPSTDPNWICQRRMNKYVFVQKMSRKLLSRQSLAHS